MQRQLDLTLAALVCAWCLRAAVGDGTVAGVLLHGLLPWWGALAWPTLVGAAALRLPGRSALAAAACGAHLAACWPPTTPQRGATQPLTLTSANLFVGNTSRDAMIAALVATDADVLALIELDTRWWDLIGDDPRLAPWSYRHVAIRPDAYGVGVLSRLPLRDPLAEVVGEATELVARLDLPDGPVDLIVVHTTPPYRADWIDAWVDHLDWLAAAGERGRRIAVGDLNTSVFHPRFDILRDAGWRDAAEASGNRLQMTWPSAFPVLGLDHALVDGPFDVDQVRVLPGPGSDHRMLRVSLRL